MKACNPGRLAQVVSATVLLSLAVLALPVVADRKPRVFITDSVSWEMVSGAGVGKQGGGGVTLGGARPQTAEIMKTFSERCSLVVVTNKQEKADYVVLLEHEGGKGLIRKDNKVAVFNKDGDMIHSGSTRSLGNAVKDACDAIRSQPESQLLPSQNEKPL